MDRDEAIAVLKEIFERSNNIDASAITLMASRVTASSGCSEYSIHMSTSLDSDSRATVQEIIKAHGLTLRESEGRLTIFRSKL